MIAPAISQGLYVSVKLFSMMPIINEKPMRFRKAEARVC